MRFKDIVKIEGLPPARVEETTDKAVYLSFGWNDEWLPLSKLEIVSEKPYIQKGKNDQVEYICILPQWLKDKIHIGATLSECCGALIIEGTDLCSTCKEHTGDHNV